MKQGVLTLTVAAMCLQLASAPARADMSSEEKAAAAIAILGIAALAHNRHHYRDGYQPADHNETAEFEAGYRDGLHNEPFNPNASTTAFAQGYDAGQKERANSLAHKTHGATNAKVPKAAMSACFTDAVSGVFQTSPGNVHVIKTAQEGADNFYIELASGHKHVVCEVNSKGEIFNTEYRRL